MKTRQRFDFAILPTLAFLLAGSIGLDDSLAQQSEGTKTRSLPAAPSPATETDSAVDVEVDKYVPPEEIVRKAFDAPPEAKAISEEHLIWVDRQRGRVYVDGYVAMQDGPLEMFACPMGTKEHESVIGSLARSSEVHAALLAVGAQPGTPVVYLPKFVPATGQRIRVWVCYWDDQGKFQVSDARRWIKKAGTKTHMEPDWVFAGSGFWKDPSNGREYYRADSGDMICVSNFTSAMMDVPIASSAEADQLQYVPFSDRIPQVGTPVRLVLVPIPFPTGKPEAKSKVEADKPPTEEILPVKSGKSK